MTRVTNVAVSTALLGSTYYSTCKKHKNYEFCATELKQDFTYKKWGYCNQKNCPAKGKVLFNKNK